MKEFDYKTIDHIHGRVRALDRLIDIGKGISELAYEEDFIKDDEHKMVTSANRIQEIIDNYIGELVGVVDYAVKIIHSMKEEGHLTDLEEDFDGSYQDEGET